MVQSDEWSRCEVVHPPMPRHMHWRFVSAARHCAIFPLAPELLGGYIRVESTLQPGVAHHDVCAGMSMVRLLKAWDLPWWIAVQTADPQCGRKIHIWPDRGRAPKRTGR